MIEDCWFAGGGRYLVNDGGGRYSVYRRCVGRWDYSEGSQPIGGFMNYHQQSIAGGENAVYQNCIAIDFNDPIGSLSSAVGNSASNVSFTNSLFVYNGAAVESGTYTHSHFQGEAGSGDNLTTCDAGLLYPVRIETGTPISGTGHGGGNRGATILKRIGVEGTHYGDPGWETLTDADLWPFPNENRIRNDFRSVTSPPDGAIPTTSNSHRGFCSESNSLTTYVWKSLGSRIPEDLYPKPAISPPTNLNVIDK